MAWTKLGSQSKNLNLDYRSIILTLDGELDLSEAQHVLTLNLPARDQLTSLQTGLRNLPQSSKPAITIF